MSKDGHPYLELMVVLLVATSPWWLCGIMTFIFYAPAPVGMLAGTVLGAATIFGIVRLVNRNARAKPPDAP